MTAYHHSIYCEKSISYGGQIGREFKKKMMKSRGKEIKLAEEKSKQEKEG
jgi:hypothetical protein